MIQRSQSLLEAPTVLDGRPRGRAIMPEDFPYMDYISTPWFAAHGPTLPLRITGIWMLANGGVAIAGDDALLNVQLDQDRAYWHACGDAYPAVVQPSTQYLLMPLGTVEYAPGRPRVFYREFYAPVLLEAGDCLIVDVGGISANGLSTIQLAWALFYETY